MSIEVPFKFKQFDIYQSESAMKVGTDGVLIGAWTPVLNRKNILDIGSGTGLISLMLAQRNSDASITAIEIDEDPAKQSKHNFETSRWSDRLSVEHISFQEFYESSVAKYDLIVSNPPFFTSGNVAPEKSRAMARHNSHLSFDELLFGVEKLLSDDGDFVVILPSIGFEDFLIRANNIGLYAKSQLDIYPTPTKERVRVISVFSRKKVKTTVESLIIEVNGRHNYSEEYINLTKDFYLKF